MMSPPSSSMRVDDSPASAAVTLEELVRPLLEMLGVVLGQESTYLTVIDEHAGLQHILLARNVAAMTIPEGLYVPWKDTLCKRALEQGVTSVHNVPDCWGDSDAARQLGIVTYVSAPVTVEDGHLFGTLCAASTSSRPISEEGEQALLLCARMIGKHIDRERAQRRTAVQAAARVESLQGRVLKHQRRLNAVLDNATVAVFLIDEQQHCIYMNPAAERLTGYTLEETSGRPLHDVVHHTRPDGTPYPLADCPIDRAFPENNQEQGEETFVHKDGTFYPVAFTASPIRDEVARIVGTVVEVQDIRQQKAVLDALSDAIRAKDQFLAMLGHELRNPLSPIVTSLELLRMRGVEHRELDIINRQVDNLTRLVDDLLDISRITRGLLEIHRKPVELCDVVARGIETARPVLERCRSILQVDVPQQGLKIEADEARLSQVISNLLNNAARFSRPGTVIQVRGWRDGTRALLAVKDEGRGVPQALQARIFEPFVQATQGKDRAMGGLGLGLAIANSLVQLHDGRMSMRSAGEDLGSEFTIELPACDDMPSATTTGTEAPRRRTVRPRRILVVDDNRDAAETLSLVLSNMGHEVLALFDAASALQQATRFAPDVAVLDIGLPVVDGYELAVRFRELFGADACPRLIALTGYGQQSDRERSRAAGFSDHLLKPVDVDRLLEVIDASA
jgi:PAS domain S-box-containing protein